MSDDQMTPTARQDAERRSFRRRHGAPGSVSYRPNELGSWIADVMVAGKRHALGRFNTKAAAERALVEHAQRQAATGEEPACT